MAEMAHYVCDIERVCAQSSGGHDEWDRPLSKGRRERRGQHGFPIVPSVSLVPGTFYILHLTRRSVRCAINCQWSITCRVGQNRVYMAYISRIYSQKIRVYMPYTHGSGQP